MSRLSYPQKLGLFALIFLFPLLVSGGYVVKDTYEKFRTVTMQREGLAHSVLLQKILRHVAQHRGMVNSYLSGERSFQENILAIQQEILHDFAKVDLYRQEFPQEMGNLDRWSTIKAHWQKLPIEVLDGKMTQNEVFASHSKLLSDIIEQISCITHLHILGADYAIEHYYHISSGISAVTLLAEFSGQLRGLGTAIAATKKYSGSQRRELIELYGMVRMKQEAIQNSTEIICKEMPIVQEELQRSMQYTDSLLAEVNASLINNDGNIAIAPAPFFTLATRAIDADFALSDALTRSLMTFLNKHIWTKKKQLFSYILFLFGGVVAVIVLSQSIYYSIIGSVNQLRDAALALANGDMATRVKLETKDEMLLIANAFNEMASTLQENIARLKLHKEQLIKQIVTDSLTGYPNRLQLQQDIRSERNAGLCLVNIDSFKEYNDSYGSEVGDAIIEALGKCLADLATDERLLLYKMAADEYALFTIQHSTKEGFKIFARQIHQAVTRKVFQILGIELRINVTLGLAQMWNSKPDDLLAAADLALKTAKLRRVHLLDYEEVQHLRTEYAKNIHWAKFVKEAIEEDRVVPFYQPIVNNATGRIEKYECLVRIIDQQGKVISPHSFLKISKQARLYTQLTRIVVEKSFAQFQINTYEFSINLTVDDILDPETESFVIKKLVDSGLAFRVTFEIVESEGIENCKEMLNFINKVKKLGCKIAVDDFGTGYSNFEYILELNVDYLKIDASMIKNIVIDPNARAITETIVAFARKVGLKTVAEFVHSREVYELEKQLGVDYSQGYYLGEPAPSIAEQPADKHATA